MWYICLKRRSQIYTKPSNRKVQNKTSMLWAGYVPENYTWLLSASQRKNIASLTSTILCGYLNKLESRIWTLWKSWIQCKCNWSFVHEHLVELSCQCESSTILRMIESLQLEHYHHHIFMYVMEWYFRKLKFIIKEIGKLILIYF